MMYFPQYFLTIFVNSVIQSINIHLSIIVSSIHLFRISCMAKLTVSPWTASTENLGLYTRTLRSTMSQKRLNSLLILSTYTQMKWMHWICECL